MDDGWAILPYHSMVFQAVNSDLMALVLETVSLIAAMFLFCSLNFCA